mmetsp:Transcript_117117/g.372982  ORF Transcript_117117/g.372982 Transcript_117117/m.372982 type:complete len:504 (-) Transcript_117117:256-1767(-)
MDAVPLGGAKFHCSGLVRDGKAVKQRAEALRTMEGACRGQAQSAGRPPSGSRPPSAGRQPTNPQHTSSAKRPLSAQRPAGLRPTSALSATSSGGGGRPLNAAASAEAAPAASAGAAVAARPPARGSRPASASAAPRRAQYPIVGRTFCFQRVSINGRLKRPKLDSDEAKLKDLLYYCREGNFREVRAIAAHYPYLLSLTDSYGMTALHHAEMSGSPVFVTQVLELYRHPRVYVLKHLLYETLEELQTDVARGFEEDSLARASGIAPGDTLEAIVGEGFLSPRQEPPAAADDVLAALCRQSGGSLFPMTLEFRGSALGEILGSDGWAPTHAAAGMCSGPQFRKILGHLLAEQEQAGAAADAGGCTPKEWLQMERSIVRSRPLSAGHAGRSPIAAAAGAAGTASRPGSASARSRCGKDRPFSARSSASGAAGRLPLAGGPGRASGAAVGGAAAEEDAIPRAPALPPGWEAETLLPATANGAAGLPATCRPISRTGLSQPLRLSVC